MFAEILEITAVIEDQKAALSRVFAVYAVHAVEIFAKARASADHLPEFRF